MNVLDKYSIRRKLIIMVVVLCVPSVLLLYQTVMLQNRTIVTTELELQGVDYARGLEQAAGPIADHRGLADVYLNGNHSRGPAMADAAKKVDEALAYLSRLETEIDPKLRNAEKWQQVTEEWRALKRDVMTLPAPDSERIHNSLLEKLRELNTLIVDRSMLILDPEETSYYLMDAAVLQIPRLQMDVFDLRSALLSVKDLTILPNAVRGDLAIKADRVNRNAEALIASIEKLSLLVPNASKEMKEVAAEHMDAALAFAGTVEDALVLSDRPQNINSTAFALGTQTYESAGQLHAVLMPQLQAALQHRLSIAKLERNVSLFGGLAVVAFALFLARMTRVHITNGAHRVVTTIERLSKGEVGRQEEVYSSDEFGQVLTAVNRMDAKLVEVVAAMRATAETVGAAAQELADGNDHLSGRTHQQAASIQQTASSMEEMTATVKQNADNAQQANRLVAGVHHQAERGGSVVHRAVGAMNEINHSSKKISDIIGVIDEIAFQTNLLALNAAVEAARAGEQGRGFAVVATEVRNLAQRSAGAAKEIKALIQDSVEKVRDGAELVNESGTTLAEIMVSIKKASDVVADIAAASQEQSAGIEQVNLSVTQMDTTTQENSALVEQSKAVSRKIQSTVQRLVHEVSFFKVSGQAIAPVASVSSTRVSDFRAHTPTRPAGQLNATPLPSAAKPKQAVPRMAAASGDGVVWKEF